MPRRAAASDPMLPDSALSVCASHMGVEIIAQEKNILWSEAPWFALTDNQRSLLRWVTAPLSPSVERSRKWTSVIRSVEIPIGSKNETARAVKGSGHFRTVDTAA